MASARTDRNDPSDKTGNLTDQAGSLAGGTSLRDFACDLASSGDPELIALLEPWLVSAEAGPMQQPDTGRRGGELLEIGPGFHCGPFRIERELGVGGMGRVFLATRTDNLNLQVALKILTNVHQQALKLFRKEATLLSGLHHPNIAHLIDAGILPGGRPWLAMEYIEGVTLTQWLEQQQPDMHDRIRLFLKVCDATSHAHQQLVIHRDIKPGNIMVQPDGEPKLLDFGIASSIDPETGEQSTITVEGLLMTPDYASPEQALGQRLGAASDVYSLGVVLYQALTGVLPYRLDTTDLMEIARRIRESPITRPGAMIDRTGRVPDPFARRLRGDLDAIVLKALERNIDRRYASVAEFADDLRRYLAGIPIHARPATLFYRLDKFIRRHRWPVFLGVTLAILLLFFSLFAQRQQARIVRERDMAAREKQTAEELSGFLVAMFEGATARAGPQKQAITAFDVMEQGRHQLHTDLTGQPVVRQRLLATMGRVYRALGNYDRSCRLLERAVTEETGKNAWDLELELIRSLQLANDFVSAQTMLDRLGQEAAHSGDPRQLTRLQHLMAHQWFLRGHYVRSGSIYAQAVQQLHTLTLEEQALFRRNRIALWSAWGQYDRAIESLELLLKLDRELYGEAHSEVATTLALLGKQYQDKSEHERADTYFQQSESIIRERFGEEHPLYIECLLNRADHHLKTGDYDTSRGVVEEARALAIKVLGEHHLLTATCFSGLGMVDSQLGNFKEAEAWHRKALTIKTRILGELHPDVAEERQSIGWAVYSQGDFKAAETIFREALKSLTDLTGEKHPRVADSLNILAIILQEQGDLDAAEELFRRALDLYKELLGEKTIDVGTCSNNLALTVKQKGDYVTAESLYRQAVAIYTELLGEEHYYATILTGNLASLLVLNGNLTEAEELFRKSTAALVKSLGEMHPAVATSYFGLADLLSEQGRYAEAEPVFQKAIKTFQEKMGMEHQRLASFHAYYGKMLFRAGRLDEAEEEMRKGLAMGLKLMGEDHPGNLGRRYMLARLSGLRGAFDEAEALLAQAETIARRQKNPHHLESVLHERARLLRDRALAGRRSNERTTAGESLFRQVLDDRRRTLGENNPKVASLLVDLAELLARSGRSAEALPLIEEAETIYRETHPPTHENHAIIASVRGLILTGLGRAEEGGRLKGQALQVLIEKLGNDHWLTRQARARQ